MTYCGRRILSTLASATFLVNTSLAVTIPYADLSGTNVDYINISEDTRAEPLALFGPPDIVGNTMDFDPVRFTAQVSSVVGTTVSEIVDGQLNFTVRSKGGFDLTNVQISEAGDFTLAGLGTAQATAMTFAPVRWTITHVDGSVLAAPLSGASQLAFTPSDTFALPSTVGTWEGFLDIDLVTPLRNDGIGGFASTVEFVMDNSLSVAASNGGSSFIAKKDFAGVSISVPEPAHYFVSTLSLFALLVGVSRRRVSGG